MYPLEAPPKLPHISRLEIPQTSTAGWQVRFRRAGRHHSRFFSDSRYGDDKEAALKAAVRWRDHELPLQPDAVLPHEASAAARLTITRGISLHERKLDDGLLYPVLQGSWKDPITGKRKGSCLSLKKWELRIALWKLITQRGQALGHTQKQCTRYFNQAYSNAMHFFPESEEEATAKNEARAKARERRKKQELKA